MVSNILQYLPKILSGTAVTIELTVLSVSIGLAIAVILTLAHKSNLWFLKFPINAYVFFIRGTPMLLQFFLIYFGSGQFVWLRATPLWDVFKSPIACAIIALAINTSAYTMVLFRGAIDSVPKGEVEACQALGMSYLQALWRVVLPRAIRIALPAYSNEVIMILKGTSLASTITVLELTGITRQIIAQTYESMMFLLVAGIIYLLINAVIIGGFKLLEKKLMVTT